MKTKISRYMISPHFINLGNADIKCDPIVQGEECIIEDDLHDGKFHKFVGKEGIYQTGWFRDLYPIEIIKKRLEVG